MGGVVGGVVGGLIALILLLVGLVLGVWCCLYRQRRRRKRKGDFSQIDTSTLLFLALPLICS